MPIDIVCCIVTSDQGMGLTNEITAFPQTYKPQRSAYFAFEKLKKWNRMNRC